MIRAFVLIGIIYCCSVLKLHSQVKIKTETRIIFRGIIDNSWEKRTNHFNKEGLLIKEETSLGGLYFRSIYSYDDKRRILTKERLELRGDNDTTYFSKIKFEYLTEKSIKKEIRLDITDTLIEPKIVYESCTHYLDTSFSVLDSQFQLIVEGEDTITVAEKYYYNDDILSNIKTKRFSGENCREVVRVFNCKGKDSLVLVFDCGKESCGNFLVKDSITWDQNKKNVFHIGADGQLIYFSIMKYDQKDSLVSETLKEENFELLLKRKEYDKLDRLVKLIEDDFDESRKVTLYSYVGEQIVNRSVYRFFLYEENPNPIFEERVEYQYTFWDK